VATIHYPATVERAGDGDFGVFFPDLPGCTSGGDTLAGSPAAQIDAAAQARGLSRSAFLADGARRLLAGG
jgi:hypothetical protein